jgi:hypothetical protein
VCEELRSTQTIMATLPPLPIVAVPKFDATLGALLIGGLVATAYV